LLIESEEGKGSLFKLTLSGIHKKEKIKVA